MGLELLHGLGGVVDESKASGLATTELGAQTKDGDLVLASLVQASELLPQLILGNVRAVGVQDVTVVGKNTRMSANRILLIVECLLCVCPKLLRIRTNCRHLHVHRTLSIL